MISIVISSQDKLVLDGTIENIQNTIGVPHEIIAIDNKGAVMGICEAYNLGSEKASHDIFCFIHEDISFQTADWGKKLVQHFESAKEYVLLGVAGGDTKGLVPSSWSSFIFPSEISLVQHYKYKSEQEPERILRTGYPDDSSLIKPVACIDGVFMAVRRKVFQSCRFDQHTFPGFHGYDIDFSLQVANSGGKAGVVFDILIHHYSEGRFNRTWLESAISVSNKWKHILPLSVRDLTRKDVINQHWTAMKNFLNKLLELEYPRRILFAYYFKFSFNRFFHLRNFIHFNKEILIRNMLNKEKILE
jgi:GT2 family glycosyltransferase